MPKYRIFTRTEKSRDFDHKVNQDKYLFSEFKINNDMPLQLIGVADGMGGLNDGEKAALHAIRRLFIVVYERILDEYLGNGDDYSLSYYAERLSDIISDAVIEANAAVCAQADPYVPTGTTISVVGIMDRYAVCANVGDSPIYYYRDEVEEFGLVSELQTVAEQEAETGLYERYSDRYYENDHRLTGSLGEFSRLPKEKIHLKVIGNLKSNDMLLICSDGALGHIQEEELYQIISDENEYNVLKELFQRARLDKNDDQTAVLVKIY